MFTAWFRVSAEIEDGVADDLPRSVECDVSASIAFEKLDAALLQEFGRGNDIGGFGVASECDDWLVFEQQENIADFLFLAQGAELLLQAKSGGVIDGAELDNGDQ